MPRFLVPTVSGALLIAVGSLFAMPGSGSAEEVQIESGDFYFCAPSFLNVVCETTITTGDTVVWNNIEGLHTITECDAAFEVCPFPSGFDSGFLNPDDSFSQTFGSVGTFAYWCDIHPVQMRGRIIVEDPVTPSPMPTETRDVQAPAPTTFVTPADVPATGATAREGSMPSWAIVLAVVGAAVVFGSGLILARLGPG